MSTRQALTNFAAVCTLGNADGRIPAADLALHGSKKLLLLLLLLLPGCESNRAAAPEQHHVSQRRVGAYCALRNWAVCLKAWASQSIACWHLRTRCPSVFGARCEGQHSSDTGGCPAWCARAAMLFAPSMTKQRVTSSAASNHCSFANLHSETAGDSRRRPVGTCQPTVSPASHTGPQHTPTTGQLQPSCKGRIRPRNNAASSRQVNSAPRQAVAAHRRQRSANCNTEPAT